MTYPTTPDGRYFVVNGRLWRATNPSLDAGEKHRLTKLLMEARRAVRSAKAASDRDALMAARRKVTDTKIALGERGAPWWADGATDFNRYLVRNTPYRDWFASLDVEARKSPSQSGSASVTGCRGSLANIEQRRD